jgi:lipid-binding SYLF domain-containing protein
MRKAQLIALALGLTAALPLAAATIPAAQAATSLASDLDRDAAQALAMLYKSNPAAQGIGQKARAILIFPNIVKAGLVFGGAYGEGVLRSGSKVDGYYNSLTASWGFQAGAQSYGYIVFLMTPKAVKYVQSTQGWEVGVGPTIVVVDQGVARNLSTSTLKDDAYAFIFDQRGLMGGVSLEGTKISRIRR